jgi:hypothetical protein
LKQTSRLPGYVPRDMNAILTTVSVADQTPNPRVQLRPFDGSVRGGVHSPFHATYPALVLEALRAPRAKAAVRPTRGPALSEGFIAKLLCALLVASATAGIVCVFLSVLERGQNWPLFNAWVGRIRGA